MQKTNKLQLHGLHAVEEEEYTQKARTLRIP